MTKLTNFDIKTIGIFQPSSAHKINGVLHMTDYIDKGFSIKYAIGKFNKKQKRPLVFDINISKYDLATKLTYKFHASLICQDEKFKEYTLNASIDEIEKCSVEFQRGFVNTIQHVFFMFGVHFCEMSGAIQIDFESAFEGYLFSEDQDVFKQTSHLFKPVTGEISSFFYKSIKLYDSIGIKTLNNPNMETPLKNTFINDPQLY